MSEGMPWVTLAQLWAPQIRPFFAHIAQLIRNPKLQYSCWVTLVPEVAPQMVLGRHFWHFQGCFDFRHNFLAHKSDIVSSYFIAESKFRFQVLGRDWCQKLCQKGCLRTIFGTTSGTTTQTPCFPYPIARGQTCCQIAGHQTPQLAPYMAFRNGCGKKDCEWVCQ